MSRDIPEADWRVFREVRELALERCCERGLAEIAGTIGDDGLGFHDRYLAVRRLVDEWERMLADAFDDPRRSTMIGQLTVIQRLGLLEPEEFARFGPETRTMIDALLRISR